MASKKRATAIVAGAAISAVVIIAIGGVRAAIAEPLCGAGFVREKTRCLVPDGTCPSPFGRLPDERCGVLERDVVRVPATKLTIGPSDWEAEGRVGKRIVAVDAFELDRFEVTDAAYRDARDDAWRAAARVTLSEARAHCVKKGGRLPTEDEWIAAAAGDRARRYPWGDTGAVCRRAAWGLVDGPCARGATSADTVGAHADGATPLGIHDLAGNVAEWVETGACPDASTRGSCTAVVRGGSYRTTLATELRTWPRREVDAMERQPWIGFRCAFDVSAK